MYRRRRLLAVFVLFVSIVGLGYVFRSPLRDAYQIVVGNEYLNIPSGSATITIQSGDDGRAVARALVQAGVTKTIDSTYRSLVVSGMTFYPGEYHLRKHMNSNDAIRELGDSRNFSDSSILIKEGARASDIFDRLSVQYGVPLADFEKIKPSTLGLPSNVVNLDGYLFPARYTFQRGQSAISMIRTMYERMLQQIKNDGIAPEEVHKVLTLASIIQYEAGSESDFYKISAVFQNRLKVGMKLQSDATVSYGVKSHTYTTTAQQRADRNPWNTYMFYGLPIGPISAPGALAIDAAMHPAIGSWLYFCTVNPQTGETEFTSTLADHEKSIAKWQAWLAAHPGW